MNLRPPAPEAGALPGCATPRCLKILKLKAEKVKEKYWRIYEDYRGAGGDVIYMHIF